MFLYYNFKQGRFWSFWQGITCLFGVVLVVFCSGIGFASPNNGDAVVASTLNKTTLDYNPPKAAITPYYTDTNLEIWINPTAGTSCQFFYKPYKATQWISTNNSDCRSILTKPMRQNNLVIDIKLVITNSNNTINTITDSYVFSSG